MRFSELSLAGAFVIDFEPHVDERGSFGRTFCEREFAEHGLPTRFPQCNLSQNQRAGTLRGMHYQAAPCGETKLVRCVNGAIFDVIIDLRPSSATHLGWFGVELSAANGRALFVPRGFAHGFMTLSDDSRVLYHMGDFYQPGAARGVRFDDPSFGIDWPRAAAVIGARDASYPDFDPSTFDG